MSGIATLVTFSLKPETSTASNTPTSPVKIRNPKAALPAGAGAGVVIACAPTVNAVTAPLSARDHAHSYNAHTSLTPSPYKMTKSLISADSYKN